MQEGEENKVGYVIAHGIWVLGLPRRTVQRELFSGFVFLFHSSVGSNTAESSGDTLVLQSTYGNMILIQRMSAS